MCDYTKKDKYNDLNSLSEPDRSVMYLCVLLMAASAPVMVNGAPHDYQLGSSPR